ncbi:MAG: GntR family transcriptional regulator [Firmicutes bacterium]|nr:GntR family transcriptional regulator [Bacillota bacterium]
MQRVKRTSVGKAVIAEIRAAITRGELKPGDQLPPERELAANLGVSRLAMREGLKVLEAMGLVEARQGEGTFITAPTTERLLDPLVVQLLQAAELHQLNEARTAVEVEMAGLAARRSSALQRERMSESLAMMERNLAVGESYQSADVLFHTTVAEAAGNPLLARMYGNIIDLVYHLVEQTQRVPGAGERALRFHTLIFKAIVARDEHAARKAMLEHLRDVQHDLDHLMTRDVPCSETNEFNKEVPPL